VEEGESIQVMRWKKTMYNPYISLPYLAPTMDHAPTISSRRNTYCKSNAKGFRDGIPETRLIG
jgi:hypothetical protein